MSVLHVYGKFICIQSSLSEPPSVCLFSGGAAGAVSRITGTIGKGLAALTFDDDYQKKRREGLNKKPANIGEGFARGGKGLVMVCVFLSVCLCLYIHLYLSVRLFEKRILNCKAVVTKKNSKKQIRS